MSSSTPSPISSPTILASPIASPNVIGPPSPLPSSPSAPTSPLPPPLSSSNENVTIYPTTKTKKEGHSLLALSQSIPPPLPGSHISPPLTPSPLSSPPPSPLGPTNSQSPSPLTSPTIHSASPRPSPFSFQRERERESPFRKSPLLRSKRTRKCSITEIQNARNIAGLMEQVPEMERYIPQLTLFKIRSSIRDFNQDAPQAMAQIKDVVQQIKDRKEQEQELEQEQEQEQEEQQEDQDQSPKEEEEDEQAKFERKKNSLRSKSFSSADAIEGKDLDFKIGHWMVDKKPLAIVQDNEQVGEGGEKKKKTMKKRKGTMSCVFGMSLGDIFQKSQLPIPIVVAQCMHYLKQPGNLKHEGIFRISASFSEVARIRSLYVNPLTFVNLQEETDNPHVVACLLKQFFAKIPEALIPDEQAELLVKEFDELEEEEEALCKALSTRLINLPYLSAVLLRFLIEFLSQIAVFSEVNKMTADNLAICFGPNLVRLADPSRATAGSTVTSFLIRFYDVIFKEVGVEECPEIIPEDSGRKKDREKKKLTMSKGFSSPRTPRKSTSPKTQRPSRRDEKKEKKKGLEKTPTTPRTRTVRSSSLRKPIDSMRREEGEASSLANSDLPPGSFAARLSPAERLASNAFASDHEKMLKQISESGISLLTDLAKSGYLLHSIVGQANFSTIQYLVDIGAPVQGKRIPDERTVAHVAASSADLDTLLYLLRSGADHTQATETGLLPIHLFCARKDLHKMKWPRLNETLHQLSSEVDLTQSEKTMGTPLHGTAQSHGDARVAEWLVSHEPRLLSCDHEGKNPLVVAKESGNEAVRNVLERSLSKSKEEESDVFFGVYSMVKELARLSLKNLEKKAKSCALPEKETPNFICEDGVPSNFGLVDPTLTKEKFRELGEFEKPASSKGLKESTGGEGDGEGEGGGLTKIQAIALLLNDLLQKGREKKEGETMMMMIRSKEGFLGALYYPGWDERVVRTLLLIHSNFIQTQDLLAELVRDRVNLQNLNFILAILLRDWHISSSTRVAGTKFIKPLFTSLKEREKKVGISVVEARLKDAITQVHADRHYPKKYQKHIGDFTSSSSQDEIALERMDDEILFRQLTTVEYLLQKRISGDFILSVFHNTASLKNALFHSSAVQKWLVLCVVDIHDPKNRLFALDRFLKLAKKCVEIGNFGTAKQIVDGLEHPSFVRLPYQSDLSPQMKETMTELKTLFGKDEEGKYTMYHKAIHSRRQSHLPFLCSLPILLEEIKEQRYKMGIGCQKCQDLDLCDAFLSSSLLDYFWLRDSLTPTEEGTFLLFKEEDTSYIPFIWGFSDHITPSMLLSRSLSRLPPK